ncbi:unnamed protein product [Staurois parvus]|uniref:Uncharacterized protein n=1 Tax=Staurois parvus TaxID=386267 RepID=A0ABN9EK36_9NEOB|nr:unnamed protein product [Staurois parvus]
MKSSPSTMISDVPGFRKILPRSEYILVPKPPEEDGSLTHPKESAILAPSAALSHNGGQNVYTLESGLSEQLIDLEGLTDEGANAVREVLPGGVYSHCAGTDKIAGEIILDDATLEIGETSTYPATSMVIEEDGGLAISRSDVPRGMSVVTVMAIQDTEENSTPSAPSQFIMLPMTNRSITETSRSIKLATTYTRRGRGSCTNPTCTFSYVTRHKPPMCPLCNQFLGGKWIPKGKQSKDKPNTTVRTTDVADSQDQSSTVTKASEKENSEAVSQLLQSSLPDQNEDWEEVIISDAHFEPGKREGNESALTEKRQEKATKPAENNATKTDKPPPVGITKAVPQASVSKTSSSSASLSKQNIRSQVFLETPRYC